MLIGAIQQTIIECLRSTLTQQKNEQILVIGTEEMQRWERINWSRRLKIRSLSFQFFIPASRRNTRIQLPPLLSHSNKTAMDSSSNSLLSQPQSHDIVASWESLGMTPQHIFELQKIRLLSGMSDEYRKKEQENENLRIKERMAALEVERLRLVNLQVRMILFSP